MYAENVIALQADKAFPKIECYKMQVSDTQTTALQK